MDQAKYQRTGSRPYRGRTFRRGGFRGGQRRDNDEDPYSKKVHTESGFLDSPVMLMFRDYAAKLDAKNDLYEILVKNSRDTTIESKRIIFLLLRCAGHQKGSLEVHQILTEARTRIKELQNTALQKIAMDLYDQDAYLFNRAYSPGLQEYIECLSLWHYLEHETLIGLDGVQKDLRFTVDGREFALLVTPSDYVLGISDLTGELMRYCITHAANPSAQVAIFRLCDFVRAVYVDFLRIPYGLCGKDFGTKIRVMFQSVIKIERVCYQLALRQAEDLPVPPPKFIMKVDDFAEEGLDGAERF
ncbi:LOW QUALITY PROTEIN: translin-associated protein X-like [Paramacrobiotus metropolitanus]|uniref:LOW QUALITY PROTEIN: translin-associated protein X-like n=1 Tax=Paramacrobiotus metropolitanus TaxID=2943436 RepID=UPI002445BC70|nr:LOW QUALITY PROTEIN: translin-associated protein X-like [Paramacrobiotus metropolitanus]